MQADHGEIEESLLRAAESVRARGAPIPIQVDAVACSGILSVYPYPETHRPEKSQWSMPLPGRVDQII